jgi:hypothetical protein
VARPRIYGSVNEAGKCKSRLKSGEVCLEQWFTEVMRCGKPLGICTLRGCPEQMKRGGTNRDKAGYLAANLEMPDYRLDEGKPV